jgi:putative chitinase
MIPLDDLITPARVARATGATLQHAELYAPFLLGACKAFDINTPLRVAGFLSQIGHESRGLATLTEDLNYSVEALLKMFGRHRISEADARRYGRTATQSANQPAIANCIYGGPWGAKNLGNVSPGDGWKHRGMGLKQLTGLDNHRRCGQALGEDFVNHPERLLMPVNAALSAAWFWNDKNLNHLADCGDVVAMTQKINGAANGLAERQALYALATAQDNLA